MRQKSESAATPAKVFGRPQSKPAKRQGTGVSPKLFYGLFTLLFTTNAMTLVGFLMAPDISRLMSGQNEVVFGAYEDRIMQLRVEVDRLQSRSYAQAGNINLQLQEVTQQQEILLEQQQYVRQLAAKAAELGIGTASADAAEATPQSTSSLSNGLTDVQSIAGSVETMMVESRLALATIADEANRSTDSIVEQLAGIGIRPKMPDVAVGMGGPFIPAIDGPEVDSLIDDANAVYETLARLKLAREAIDVAPIHDPLGGVIRTSSSYGNRKDPFTGKRAFHAGLDTPAPSGTNVLSAGYGKVTFVGQKSGYGNVVEVTHGSGLVTRYAHLLAFLVKEGQVVGTGMPIAKVGSTGRSTGPHLHFEIRKSDSPQDPRPYLAAGKRLQRYLGA